MRALILSLLAASLFVSACSSDDLRGKGQPRDMAQAIGFDAGPGGTGTVVYAHSSSFLFSIDPETLAISPIGAFQWPAGSDEMTDIAVDKDGKIIGISFTRIYAVDRTDAKCTFLSDFSGDVFNGLSFIAADQANAGGAELLVGASRDGTLYKIDPGTGAQALLGSYGDGWGSSGDLVSVQGATFATAKRLFDFSDTLVSVDPATGKATVVGPTGRSNIWGLGYWKQKLFGFSETEGMLTIDIATGNATPVAGNNSTTAWYGAGVTTSAPTVL